MSEASQGHSHLILHVSFGPSSTVVSTSSFDRTVKIWDVVWFLTEQREATKQIRFQPQFGKLLATSAGNMVDII